MPEPGRVRTLNRLHRVYGLLAEQRLAEAQEAVQSEVLAERELMRQRDSARNETHAERTALLSIEPEHGAVHALASTVHLASAMTIEESRAARRALVEERSAAHRASCLERDQIGHVLEDAKRDAAWHAARREQVESDDRYLARRLRLSGAASNRATEI